MGRYIDWASVVSRYSDVSKLIGADEADSVYIEGAESFVVGLLSTKFSDELLLQSNLIKQMMVDAVYMDIQTTRQPKKYDALFKAITNKAKLINKGSLLLVDSSGAVASADKSTLWSSTENYTPVFGMSDIIDMEVDQDQIDDEDNARD